MKMERQLPSGKSGREVGEKISFCGTFCGKYRVLAGFVIALTILTAAFAATGIWRTTENGAAIFDGLRSYFDGEKTDASDQSPAQNPPTEDGKTDHETPPTEREDAVPNGAIPIVSMDLSCLSRGEAYFLNETPYMPAVSVLLEKSLTLSCDADSSAPLVLIVHTHTVESYLDEGLSYVEGDLAALTYSADAAENMLAVGKTLGEYLNRNGIPTLLCTVIHTGEGMSLQGSYGRAEESIRAYLQQYPSIQLVIDLHRDAVMTEDGEYVRSALPSGDESLAQVMAVVGTDCNGTEHGRWEDNLALALQLRRAMNEEVDGIGRPIYLRSSSYNQELAPYSLLLEIGTGGNSLEQAKRTAEVVGSALVKLFIKD